MKMFTHRIFTRRRIIFIFFFAIFLPSLIAGYLSLSTFPKRREAVKQFLESNLWISGEAALKSAEEALLEYEKKVLKSENFNLLRRPGRDFQTDHSQDVIAKDTAGQLFLLDPDYKIIFPETGRENTSGFLFGKETPDSLFEQTFQQAEYFEFNRKNYIGAIELYRECALNAPSKQKKAFSFEGLGRCLITSGKLAEAGQVYNELNESFGHVLNKAGHPYGIIALFQLYEIEQARNMEKNSLDILLNLYEKLRDGTWIVSPSIYDFYTLEIETILNDKFSSGDFPEIRRSYDDLQKRPSPYRQALVFSGFLAQQAIPVLKEKISLSHATGDIGSGRFLIAPEKDFFLVSYAEFPGFQSGQSFYGGFCWDLNLLKDQIMPGILKKITMETGLDLKIIDEINQDATSGIDENKSNESLVLNFRIFPLPWKLAVFHPEIKNIEKAADREILLYGILLVAIVALMFLGAVLIARDIARESETSQLKTEFVNNISHELKTPLTLIRLYGETLQRKENLTIDERRECYEIITKESERLSHMINNVLDFSRIEMGKKEFDLQKGYLQDVISDTLESYRYHLEKKGFTIHSNIARDLPEMYFDGEAMASVLINLLSNAMKFSPKEKEVTVNLSRDDGNAVLMVADKGIGISPDDKSRIFERFYRSENKTVSETRGSGLGLTLVRHIAEAHNGKIEVKSELGKGSVFSVILPISDTENDKSK